MESPTDERIRKSPPIDSRNSSPISRSPSPPPAKDEESKDSEQNLEFFKKEYQRLKDMRSGGRYVPPAKLRDLEEKLGLHKSPEDLQRARWETLKKNINSLINKVNHSNIKIMVQDIFKLNLIRGRGLFCRSILKAQSLALPYTPVYASLTAIVNTKLPIVGELLLTRVILQFKRAFRRNNKQLCLSSIIFIAHLCNHQVAHEIIALEILSLLLQNPTDDSVELAVAFVKEAGAFLNETSKTAMIGVFDRFREVLHEGNIEKRTQYMIEVLFQIRKENYKDHPVVPQDLDLVEEDEQITHMIGLDDQLKAQDTLNVFKFDPNYEKNEAKYDNIKHDILGSSDEESEGDDEDDDDEEEEENEEPSQEGTVKIKDMTNTELTNLRKNIYLNIMSSMSVDEAAHKLFKIQVPEGKENEIVNMIVETCSQEKIYNKTYGSVANRFCYKSKFWRNLFDEAFCHYYEIIHRYDTNQIRNIATLFGYILAADGLDWEVFEVVHMNEEDSTSSSRIFMKILFEEMKQEMGVNKMAVRFKEEYLEPFLVNLFPKDKKRPEDTRFSINYFTAIGLGILTEDMRDFLENMPPPTPSPKKSDIEESDRESGYGSERSLSPIRGRRRSFDSKSDSEPESDDERRSGSARRADHKRRPSRSLSPISRSPSQSPIANVKLPERGSNRSNHRRSQNDSPSRSPPRERGSRNSRQRYSSPSPERGSRRGRRYSSESRSPPRDSGRYQNERRRRRRSDVSYDSEESDDDDRRGYRDRRSEDDGRKRKRAESNADREDYYESKRMSGQDKKSQSDTQSREDESTRNTKEPSSKISSSTDSKPSVTKSYEEAESSRFKENESRRRGRAAAADYL